MTGRATLPAALRLALLLGLGALFLARPDPRPDPSRALLVRGDTAGLRALAGVLAGSPRSPRPPAVLRAAGAPPTEAELALLTELARRVPLVVELADDRAPLLLRPPESPRAGRAAAVGFEARDGAGDSVVVRLLGGGDAVLDSVRVARGADGVARGAFRVRPERPGWVEWVVATGDVADRTSAWVAPAEPPRVLVVGAPSWESRGVLRALEAAGLRPASVQPLGRDNVVTGGGAAARWWTADALADYDVVLLFPGADPPDAALDALAAHVARGRGALVAGSSGLAALGLASGWGAERAVSAGGVAWTGPAELAPLPWPATDPPARARAVTGVGVAGAVAMAAGEDPLLVLAPLGRGRVAALGALETWRAAIAAGRTVEHREFWRGLVDWLAAPAADAGVRVGPDQAAAPATVTVRVPDADASPLTLLRPDGSEEPLDVRGGVARFVAADTGLHRLVAAPDGDVPAAFRAVVGDSAPVAADGRARLALLAAASGGAVLERSEFAARRGSVAAVSWSAPLWWLGYGLLLLLATTEWTLRRLRGLP